RVPPRAKATITPPPILPGAVFEGPLFSAGEGMRPLSSLSLPRLIGRGVLVTRNQLIRPQASPETQQGGRDERSTGSGGHAQGRVHPDGGRQAPALGRQRAAL